jgi:hypothetical protein
VAKTASAKEFVAHFLAAIVFNFSQFKGIVPRDKYFLRFLKSLTNSKNPSSMTLLEACSSFQVAACGSKSCSESRV